MKKYFRLFFAITLFTYVCNTGCKEVTNVTNEQILSLRDSIFKIVPSTVEVAVDPTTNTMKVIIYDISLHRAAPEKKHDLAIEIGEISMYLFGPDNYIKSGKLIVSKEKRERSGGKDPEDGIVIDLKIDSLREHDEHLIEYFSSLHK